MPAPPPAAGSPVVRAPRWSSTARRQPPPAVAAPRPCPAGPSCRSVLQCGRGRRRSPRGCRVESTSHLDASLCRMTLVTPSRSVQANSSRHLDGTSSAAVGRSARCRRTPTPCARRRSRRPARCRACRGRSSVRRPVRRGPAARRSASSARARSGSSSNSRSASSALTEMTVSEWPRMSCRSRAIRARSSSTASSGDSSRRRQLAWRATPAGTPHTAAAARSTARS